VLAKKGDIKWGRFPDSFPNLFIDKPHQTVRGKHLVFFASFFHPESMFAQLSGALTPLERKRSVCFQSVALRLLCLFFALVLFHLPRYCARSLVVVLPYFPTGTMERVDEGA
jgi:hypothetical protein